jgi:hypothetical protein
MKNIQMLQQRQVFASQVFSTSSQRAEKYKKTPTAFEIAFKKHYRNVLQALLDDSVKEENILGKGSRALVCRIPKMPEFVLRLNNTMDFKNPSPEFSLRRLANPLPLLNIGQPVAGSSGGEIKILRHQAGIHSGIPYPHFFERYADSGKSGMDSLLGEQIPMLAEDIQPYRGHYVRHLEKVAKMPQAAYDDLAKKILVIKSAGLFIDPCSLNILLDQKNKKFNTVDHQEKIGPYQNILGMACALIDTMFVDLESRAIDLNGQKSNETFDQDLYSTQLRHQILKKTFLAAFRTGLNIPEEACPINVFNLRQRSFGMDYACDISGFQNQWMEIQKLLLEATPATVSESDFLKRLNKIYVF